MVARKKSKKFKSGDCFNNDGKLGCACGAIKAREMKNATSPQFCDNCSTDALVGGGFEIVGIKGFNKWYSTSSEYFGEPDRQNISNEKSNQQDYPTLIMVADIYDILSIVIPFLIMIACFYNIVYSSMEPLLFFWFIFVSFCVWLGCKFLAENIRLFINIANDLRSLKNRK